METLSSRYFLALYRYGPENIQAHTNFPCDKKNGIRVPSVRYSYLIYFYGRRDVNPINSAF